MIPCPNCGEIAWESLSDCMAPYCGICGWSEDEGYPMTPDSWQRMLNDGWEAGLKC